MEVTFLDYMTVVRRGARHEVTMGKGESSRRLAGNGSLEDSLVE